MILPCQDFCTEFMNSCANVLPGDLRDRMKCSVLATESEGPGDVFLSPVIHTTSDAILKTSLLNTKTNKQPFYFSL